MEQKNFTCIANSFRAKAKPATREQWEEVRNSAQLASLSGRINNAKTEEEAKKLKGRLPVWTPSCAEFRNNHRKESEVMMPLNRLMLDIDEKGHTNEIMNAMTRKGDQLFLEVKDYILRVLLVETSIRFGTHVMVEMPEGATAKVIQEQVSEKIGYSCDPAVKNVAGCIFMVPGSYTRFVDEELFVVNNTDNSSEKEVGATKETAKTEAQNVPAVTIEDQKEAPKKTYADDQLMYEGIPYSTIIERYWLLNNEGKEPCKGNRDVKTFELALHIRCICDYDAELMEQIIPCYAGFSEEERRKCINSALKADHGPMPYLLKRVLNSLKNDRVQAMAESASENKQPDIPELPEVLPEPLEHISSKVSDYLKPTVIEAAFPAFCSHLHGISLRYTDGKLYNPTIMSILISGQSTGKSFINEPIDCILEDIRQRDKENQKRENEWRELNRRKGANKDRTPRPTDICIQCMPCDLTSAAMNQAMIDADNNGHKPLHIKVDEIDGLLKMTNNKPQDFALLARCNFDTSNWGQRRVGLDSVNGECPCRININASCTPSSGANFFKKSWFSDGTMTRFHMNTIVKPEDRDVRPYAELYDDVYKEKLKPYIDRLNSAKGVIDCPEANRVADEMTEELREIAEMAEDKGYETFSVRSVRTGWYKAIIAYIMCDYKWDSSIEEYMRYSIKRDMWVKMHYYGNQIHEAVDAENYPKGQQPNDLLVQCPDEFTEEEFIQIRRRNGKQDGDHKSTLRCWRHRHKIEYDSTTKTYHKIGKAC